MRILLSIFLAAATLTGPVWAQEGVSEATAKKTEEAAKSYLAMFDEARYSEAWEKSAKRAKGVVGEAEFVETVRFARNKHGKLRGRTPKSNSFHTKLPRLPEGQYAIFDYDSRFVKTPSTNERVAMELEDGEWRLIGYFILPLPK